MHAGSRLLRITVPAAATFAAAGALSGLLLGVRGAVLDALEWALRTVVVIAAMVAVAGGAIWVARVRHRLGPRRLGWLAAAIAVAAFAWVVAIPVLYGLYLSHLPARRQAAVTGIGPGEREVVLAAQGGITLRGSYLPSRNRAVVLALHGTGSSRAGVASHARLLTRHGYGVLLVDMAGHGASGGRSTSISWRLDDSLDAALDWLAARPDVDRRRIALLGVSLGGETALQLAARRPDVRAVVAEGTAGSTLADARAARQDVLTVVQLGALSVVTTVLAGRAPVPDVELVRCIAPRPLLLISAGNGLEAAADRAFARAGGPTVHVWNLPRAPHAAALRVAPAAYERRVVGFLDRALGVSSPRPPGGRPRELVRHRGIG